MVVFKAAHLPTTPHTSATPVEPVFTALWFFPSFYSFSDSLTCQFYQVCCVVFCFLFSFSEQETKVAPETLSHWDMAELPHWYTPLTGSLAAFWKGRNPARPWGSPPILLTTSERLVDPDETELGCFFQATSLCLLQPPCHCFIVFGKWNMSWTCSGRLAISAYMWQILG